MVPCHSGLSSLRQAPSHLHRAPRSDSWWFPQTCGWMNLFKRLFCRYRKLNPTGFLQLPRLPASLSQFRAPSSHLGFSGSQLWLFGGITQGPPDGNRISLHCYWIRMSTSSQEIIVGTRLWPLPACRDLPSSLPSQLASPLARTFFASLPPLQSLRCCSRSGPLWWLPDMSVCLWSLRLKAVRAPTWSCPSSILFSTTFAGSPLNLGWVLNTLSRDFALPCFSTLTAGPSPLWTPFCPPAMVLQHLNHGEPLGLSTWAGPTPSCQQSLPLGKPSSTSPSHPFGSPQLSSCCYLYTHYVRAYVQNVCMHTFISIYMHVYTVYSVHLYTQTVSSIHVEMLFCPP